MQAVFDDAIKSPNGKTISELKAIAKNLAAANKSIKYTHALTAVLCGADFNVRDVSQVYPGILAKAFGFDPDLQLESIDVFKVANAKFLIHFKLSNGKIHQLTLDGADKLDQCKQVLCWKVSGYDKVIHDGEDDFIESIEVLLEASQHNGSGGHAAKQLL